jgi:hypothetical protein
MPGSSSTTSTPASGQCPSCGAEVSVSAVMGEASANHSL